MTIYLKTNFNNQAPPGISAAELNKLGQGVEDAHAELAAHEARTDNPHAVTAAQVGAVAKTGDTMTGALANDQAAPGAGAFAVLLRALIAAGDKFRAAIDDQLRLVIQRWTGAAWETAILLDDADGRAMFAKQVVSSVATGTAPLSVASTTVVPNLNADMVDGKHAGDFPQIATGSYTGDGAGVRTITVGFTPKYVIVASRSGTPTYYVYAFSNINGGSYGLFHEGSSTGVSMQPSSQYVPLLTTNGFSVTDNTGPSSLNDTNKVYDWVAIG